MKRHNVTITLDEENRADTSIMIDDKVITGVVSLSWSKSVENQQTVTMTIQADRVNIVSSGR